MTILSTRKTKRYPPEISLFPFNIYRVLAESIKVLPDPVQSTVTIWIEKSDTLAFIRRASGAAEIVMHPLLNHPETPVEVVRHIVLHELLHLWIRPEEIDGKLVMHPPEFWQAEKRYVPWVKCSASRESGLFG